MYCSWSWAEKHILIEGRPRCYTKSPTMQKWSSNWWCLGSSHMYCSWALTSRPRRYTWSPTVWDMFSTNTRPHQLCWGDWKMGTVISCENCCKMAGYCGVGTALKVVWFSKVISVSCGHKYYICKNAKLCTSPVHSLAVIALAVSVQQHDVNWRKKELGIVPASYGLEGKMNHKTAAIDVWFLGDYPLTSY